MTVLEVLALVLTVFLEVWRHRNDPEQARIRAAALATEALREDKIKFREALARNDAAALSEHFERLRDRVQEATRSRRRDPE